MKNLKTYKQLFFLVLATITLNQCAHVRGPLPKNISGQLPELPSRNQVELKAMAGVYDDIRFDESTFSNEWVKFDFTYGITDKLAVEYNPEAGAFFNERIWTMHSAGINYQVVKSKFFRMTLDFGGSLGFGQNQVGDTNKYEGSFTYGGYAGTQLGLRFNKTWGMYYNFQFSALKSEDRDLFLAYYQGLGFEVDFNEKSFIAFEGGYINTRSNESKFDERSMAAIMALAFGFRF